MQITRAQNTLTLNQGSLLLSAYEIWMFNKFDASSWLFLYLVTLIYNQQNQWKLREL